MTPTTPDPGTIILYTLSTLAQTCAALAAFVGAVGIFRLQAMRDSRRDAERDMRGSVPPVVGLERAQLLPLPQLHTSVVEATGHNADHPAAQAYYRVRERWLGFSSEYRRSRFALFFFEGWNLLVIGTALVGFNYVPALASWPWTRCALWVVALGTVGVTFVCVVAWTGEGGQFSETLRNKWNRLVLSDRVIALRKRVRL